MACRRGIRRGGLRLIGILLAAVALLAAPALASSGRAGATGHARPRTAGSVVTPMFNAPTTMALSTASNTTNEVLSLDLAPLYDHGVPDLVANVNYTPSGGSGGLEALLIAQNQGDGTFAAPTMTTNPDPGSARQFGTVTSDFRGRSFDFNHDGTPDAIEFHGANGNPEVYFGHPDASSHAFGWTSGPSLPMSGTLTDRNQISVADINGDNKPDVAFVDTGGVQVYVNNGDGTFTHACSDGTTTCQVSYPDSCAGTLDFGDLNGDGFPDLAVGLGDVNSACSTGSGYAPSLSVLMNRGAADPGAFGSERDLTNSPNLNGFPGAFSLVTGDWNGDGKDDVAWTNYNGYGGSLTTMLSNGDGTFAAPVNDNYANGSNAGGSTHLAVADLNHDGFDDLAFGWGNSLIVLASNGDGTFTQESPITIAGANGLTLAVAGDLNSDGMPDLVLGDGTGTNAYVLQNATPLKPTITPEGVDSFGTDSATVSAQIAANGENTFYHVSYGSSPDPGTWQSTSDQEVPGTSGYTPIPEEVTLPNLQPNTTYYYRWAATSNQGVVFSDQQSFKTNPAGGTTPKGTLSITAVLQKVSDSSDIVLDPSQTPHVPFGTSVRVFINCSDQGGPGITGCGAGLTGPAGPNQSQNISNGQLVQLTTAGSYDLTVSTSENGGGSTLTDDFPFVVDPGTTSTVGPVKITGTFYGAGGVLQPDTHGLVHVTQGDPLTFVWGCTTDTDHDAGVKSCAAAGEVKSTQLYGSADLTKSTSTLGGHTIEITGVNTSGKRTGPTAFDYDVAAPPKPAVETAEEQDQANKAAYQAALDLAKQPNSPCDQIKIPHTIDANTGEQIVAGVYCPDTGTITADWPFYKLVAGDLTTDGSKIYAPNPLSGLASSSPVIGAGAGNVIAAGAGNVIGAGAGNVIAAGAGNIILVPGSTADKLISDKGLGIISDKGLGVIAAGAGNILAGQANKVIGAGAGNILAQPAQVIAAGAGNIVSLSGGSVINAGAYNLVAPGGASLISNLASAPIITSPGSGLISNTWNGLGIFGQGSNAISSGSSGLVSSAAVVAGATPGPASIARVKAHKVQPIATGKATSTGRGEHLRILIKYTKAGGRLMHEVATINLTRRKHHDHHLLSIRLRLTQIYTPKHGKRIVVHRTFTVTPDAKTPLRKPRPKKKK